MTIINLLEASFAANAFEFTLEKFGLKAKYTYIKPKGWPEWCQFCVFFWFGFVYCFHDAKWIGLDWSFFYGLVIAQIARIIHIIYLRLHT